MSVAAQLIAAIGSLVGTVFAILQWRIAYADGKAANQREEKARNEERDAKEIAEEMEAELIQAEQRAAVQPPRLDPAEMSEDMTGNSKSELRRTIPRRRLSQLDA